MDRPFKVEIRATDGTWFVAQDGDKLAAVEADALIVSLREQGFTARGRFAELPA